MSEEQHVSLNGCGYGPTKIVEDGENKVFESVIAKSKTKLDIVYGYVDDSGDIKHIKKEINLTFDNDNFDRLFWDNE